MFFPNKTYFYGHVWNQAPRKLPCKPIQPNRTVIRILPKWHSLIMHLHIIDVFIFTAKSSAGSLLEKMREDGFTLKQSMLGRLTDPKAANEV